MKRFICMTLSCMLLFSIAACGPVDMAEPTLSDIPQKNSFSDFADLPSDGLAHDPYGWDSLYGEKEVPVVWWQREPRDAMAREQTCINIAVSAALNDAEIWISWVKNGMAMEALPCKPRANLQVGGIAKTKYCGYIPELGSGDYVEYMICAGRDGNAEKALGPFSLSAAQWEQVMITGAVDVTEDSATLLGSSGEISVRIPVEIIDGNTVTLRLENGGAESISAESPVLSNGALSFLTAPNGGFTLVSGDRELVRCSRMALLTDGTVVRKVQLTLVAEDADRFYGFGMKYDSLDQREKNVDTYCVNWYKDQIGETYTPVPYYFVPDKYGIFVDSTYYSRFEMATKDHTDTCVLEVDTGNTGDFSVPIHLFAGDNSQIAAAYANIAGKAELPPVWAFGPWLSANEWDKQAEIMEQMNKTLEYGIGTTVIVIEAWSDEQTFYTFNDSEFEPVDGAAALDYEDFTFIGRWPDPKGMVNALHENDIKCVLWQIPVLKYSADATAQSLRDQSYATEQGYVLRYADGGTYRLPGGTWFGNSLLVDFTNDDAANWFLEKRRYLLEDIGIDGFKTDGGEFVWGRDVIAFDGTRGDELRNAYPDLYAQAFYDFGNEVINEAITFSRAGGSSMQTHPLCWVGDQNSSFFAFQDAIRATLSASMSGIPFVAWDIAGFSGDIPTEELYQRSVAQAAFSPVMQIHSEAAGDPQPSQARTPWNIAEQKGNDVCLETYRFYANLRMNLLPYIYTEAKWSAETGEPMMRSMAYAFPQDKDAAKYEFQYMFGRDLLVAPATKANVKRADIYLPDGVWYDFFTGERYEGGIHSIPADVNEIPVFVREGTIIPINTDESGALGSYVGNSCTEYNNQTYISFPGDGEYTWYDYVEGKYVRAEMSGSSFLVDGQKSANYFKRGEHA